MKFTKFSEEQEKDCGLATQTIEGLTWHIAYLRIANREFLEGKGTTQLEAISNLRNKVGHFANELSLAMTEEFAPHYRKAEAEKTVEFFKSITDKKEKDN